MRVVGIDVEKVLGKDYKIKITAMAKCISIREIPKKYYDGMTLLNPNSGMTSLVFDKDDNTVRIFTKDDMKKEWLIHSWGLEMGNYVDCIYDTRFKDIHIIDMPKLYPLSPENRKIAKQVVDAIKRGFVFCTKQDPWARVDNVEKEINKLKGKPKKLGLQLINFVRNYDPSEQYGFDVSIRNFKQTKRGRLVMLDPVADAQLIKMFRISRNPALYRNHGVW